MSQSDVHNKLPCRKVKTLVDELKLKYLNIIKLMLASIYV